MLWAVDERRGPVIDSAGPATVEWAVDGKQGLNEGHSVVWVPASMSK